MLDILPCTYFSVLKSMREKGDGGGIRSKRVLSLQLLLKTKEYVFSHYSYLFTLAISHFMWIGYDSVGVAKQLAQTAGLYCVMYVGRLLGAMSISIRCILI